MTCRICPYCGSVKCYSSAEEKDEWICPNCGKSVLKSEEINL